MFGMKILATKYTTHGAWSCWPTSQWHRSSRRCFALEGWPTMTEGTRQDGGGQTTNPPSFALFQHGTQGWNQNTHMDMTWTSSWKYQRMENASSKNCKNNCSFPVFQSRIQMKPKKYTIGTVVNHWKFLGVSGYPLSVWQAQVMVRQMAALQGRNLEEDLQSHLMGKFASDSAHGSAWWWIFDAFLFLSVSIPSINHPIWSFRKTIQHWVPIFHIDKSREQKKGSCL